MQPFSIQNPLADEELTRLLDAFQISERIRLRLKAKDISFVAALDRQPGQAEADCREGPQPRPKTPPSEHHAVVQRLLLQRVHDLGASQTRFASPPAETVNGNERQPAPTFSIRAPIPKRRYGAHRTR